MQSLPFWPGGLILLLLSLGTGAWAAQNLQAARKPAERRQWRVQSLYYGIVLAGLSASFALTAAARTWPAVPFALAFAPAILTYIAAMAIRLHKGFAGWLLDRLV